MKMPTQLRADDHSADRLRDNQERTGKSAEIGKNAFRRMKSEAVVCFSEARLKAGERSGNDVAVPSQRNLPAECRR